MLFKSNIYILTCGVIVTRDRVPSAILKKWRPSASGNRPSAQDIGSDDEDGSLDGADNVQVSSPLPLGPLPLPSTQPALAVGHHNNGSDDEEDVISISGKKNLTFKNFG